MVFRVMKIYLQIILLGIAAFIFSCDVEEDCVGCDLNPKVKLEFKATGTRALYDSLLDAINEDISVFTDSLSTQLPDDVRSNIMELLSTLRVDSAKYDEAINLFRVGKIKIGTIEAMGSAGFEQFNDSTIRDFAIPVNMQRDTSQYVFHYHDHIDTLQVHYQREITQNLEGVRMRIKEIAVNEEITTFDSVKVKCYSSNCSNDITTIEVYF